MDAMFMMDPAVEGRVSGNGCQMLGVASSHSQACFSMIGRTWWQVR